MTRPQLRVVARPEDPQMRILRLYEEDLTNHAMGEPAIRAAMDEAVRRRHPGHPEFFDTVPERTAA